MATEDKEHHYLDEFNKRGRSGNRVSAIYLSTKNMPLIRSSSIGAQRQGKEGTCYAYVAARLITRYITQKFPDQFEMNDEEVSLLYDDQREENCFLHNSSDYNEVIKTLTIDKCSIDKRYNHMLLFYFTLFSIKNKFGCKGYQVEKILGMFETQIEALYNITNEIPKNTYTLSVELDALAIEKFIQPLIMFRQANVSINTTFKTDWYSISPYSNVPGRNWILNFPEGAKRALENKMYVAFTFSLAKNQWETINKVNIFDSKQIDTR